MPYSTIRLEHTTMLDNIYASVQTSIVKIQCSSEEWWESNQSMKETNKFKQKGIDIPDSESIKPTHPKEHPKPHYQTMERRYRTYLSKRRPPGWTDWLLFCRCWSWSSFPLPFAPFFWSQEFCARRRRRNYPNLIRYDQRSSSKA